MPILTLSSDDIPPRPISTIAARALVGGGADPGRIGSSVKFDDEGSEGSSTYLRTSQ
jgi:hypothetical protein